MEQNAISKHTISFGLSLALCAVANALLVIAKERSKGVAAWMQKITGHHWITHIALILILFALCGACFAKMNNGQGPKLPVRRLINIICSAVLAGVLVILGYYIIIAG